jgi:predicted RNase H-like HicB family nuclease
VRSSHTFTAVIERDEEGYFVATVPALAGCHTQARDFETLIECIREVIGIYRL